jgi:hypothetical protein
LAVGSFTVSYLSKCLLNTFFYIWFRVRARVHSVVSVEFVFTLLFFHLLKLAPKPLVVDFNYFIFICYIFVCYIFAPNFYLLYNFIYLFNTLVYIDDIYSSYIDTILTSMLICGANYWQPKSNKHGQFRELAKL